MHTRWQAQRDDGKLRGRHTKALVEGSSSDRDSRVSDSSSGSFLAESFEASRRYFKDFLHPDFDFDVVILRSSTH